MTQGLKYPKFTEHGSPPCSQMDPEVYFPEKHNGMSGTAEFRIAKSICQTCPYQSPCLEWALEHNELGVWGGLTERERTMLKRNRRAVR